MQIIEESTTQKSVICRVLLPLRCSVASDNKKAGKEGLILSPSQYSIGTGLGSGMEDSVLLLQGIASTILILSHFRMYNRKSVLFLC